MSLRSYIKEMKTIKYKFANLHVGFLPKKRYCYLTEVPVHNSPMRQLKSC